MNIKFGTSGWREIIADKFTYDNLSLVLEAIVDYLKTSELGNKGIVIGRDTRFLGEEFSKLAAEVLGSHGIKAYLCDRDLPTPVIAYEITRRKAGGGLNFTASHNPPDYQGIKFSTDDGAPALPEITKKFEAKFSELYEARQAGSLSTSYESYDALVEKGMIELINPQPTYLDRLKELVDTDVIARSGIKVVYDAMYGTAREYTDKFLIDLGTDVEVMNNHRDVYFGGRPPEPSEKNIPELIARTKERGQAGEFVIGIANDGDADRYAAIDSTGTYLQANKLLAILFHYALKHKKEWTGCVVRTLATTHLIDAIAKKEGIVCHDVPVGFKYIGEVMMREDMILGGEESNGLSVYKHIPEKDGVLACLLFVEIAAQTKKPLSEYLQELYKEYGYFYTERQNYRLSEEKKNALLESLQENTPTEISGVAVDKVDRRDGVKMICQDGSWFLVRFSGTEPVVRFYAEAGTKNRLDEILSFAKSLL